MVKNIIYTALFLAPFFISSQVAQNSAPWMKDNNLKKKGTLSLNEISNSAENFFKTIDRNKKGSGLKPFKRWEYHWSYFTKSDGTIAPASEFWTAWEQKNNLNKTSKNNANDTSNWTSLGPFSHTNTASWSPGQGRVNVVAVDPSNPNTYYVGAPAGGIWKSTDAGINWQPLTDYLPQIGVSGIAIHPTDPNTIYIATGDDDSWDSYAIGVMKTTDGGATWNATGTISADSMNDIYIDPSNTNTVLVATDQGVYKSTNAGSSWSLKLAGNIRDLKMKPGNSTMWYAASSNTIYRSINSGESFSAIVIPGFENSTRIVLEVTAANSNYVYFVSSGNILEDGNVKERDAFIGLYRSTNSGVTFTKTAETNDIFKSSQAWYDLALTVSDSDPNIVYVGVLNIWKSTNGGNNFSQLNDWSSPTSPSYTHADIHFMRFINGKFFAGTDGGVYVSTNHGENFTDLTENLAISQFYKISVAKQNSGNIVGGLQDNGGYAYKDNRWNNYFGADGMDCAINSLNPDNYFGFIQYGGSLYETTDGGLTRKSWTGAPAAETGASDSGGRWVTPLVSNSKGEMYSGYSQLYKLINGNWSKISNYNFGGDLYHIEIDPNNDNNIYVSRSSGLYKSTDAGKTFSPLAFAKGTVNSIEISHNDSNVAWIVVSSGVYKTTNLLNDTPIFTNITGNLPTESKIVLRHHPGHKDNRIYLGTTLGVYYTDDTLSQWVTFDNKLPNVAVRDIEINEKDAKLYAATYGRGIFMSDITKSLPTNDIKLVSIDSPINDYNSCGVVTPTFTVRNQGVNSISAITVNYNIDGNTNSIYNWTGTLASEATTKITIPQFSITTGKNHTLNIETIITNDLYSSNNKRVNSFLLNLSNVTPTIMNSFETSNDELLVETSGEFIGDLWQRGAPSKTLLNSAATGTNAYITGLTGNHPDKTTSYLYTECYDLTLVTNPILSFRMAFDIEEDWDHMYVEYSTNKGETWNILGAASDANWYNSSATVNGLPGKQWTGLGEDSNPLGGTNATIHDYSYDLTSFTNESNIVFRFKFIADAAENEEGAMIDDLVITGVLPVHEFDEIGGLSIYPNPSNSIFNINWAQGNDFSISVFDLTGKLLIQEKSDSKSLRKFSLDMSKFGKGIYFANIKVDDKQSTKKLILK